MTGSKPSGVLAFEVYLLFQMGGGSKVLETLRALDLNVEAMDQTADEVGNELGFNQVGHGIELYSRLLGAAVETTPEPGISPGAPFAGSLRHRFHLPIWPDLDFIVRSHPKGWGWGPEFVRRPGARPPEVSSPTRLEPWSVLQSEVIRRFGPFEAEYGLNFSKQGIYVVEAETRRPIEVTLAFEFALLQSVETQAARSRNG